MAVCHFMKENPSAPAETIMKHIRSSRNRVDRMARDAEYFRTGLRQLESDAVTLRNVLEDKPEDLARFERSYMAMQYVAGSILSEFDRLVRMEMGLQQECQRWLHGKVPALEVGRPHLAYQQGNPGVQRNGPVPPTAKGIQSQRAKAHPVPEGQRTVAVKEGDVSAEVRGGPDRNLAVGYYRAPDGSYVWLNAYDEVVPPPANAKEILAISIDGIGEKSDGPVPDAPQAVEPAAPPEAQEQTNGAE